MILAGDSTAQEAVAKLSQQIESSDSSWSDWDLLEDPEFCGLRGRVEALEVPLPDRLMATPLPWPNWMRPSSASQTSRAEGRGVTLEVFPARHRHSAGEPTRPSWTPKSSWPSAH